MDKPVLYVEIRCVVEKQKQLELLKKASISILLDGEDLILGQQVNDIRVPRLLPGQVQGEESGVEWTLEMRLPGRCFKVGRHILNVQIDRFTDGENPPGFPLTEPLRSAPVSFTIVDPEE